MAANEKLFTKSDGNSIIFYMRPCAERQKIRPTINQHGGIITSNPVTANAIKLAEGGSIVSGNDYLSSKYVEECVTQNKLLDEDDFRIKPGTVAPAHTSDDACSISSDDSMSPADYITKVQHRDIKGRTKYTKEEDLAIIHHLITLNLYRDATGLKIWKDLERLKVTSHTAQSMNTRYRKIILPNIHDYGVERSWISKLTGVIAPKADTSFSVDDLFKKKQKSQRKEDGVGTILDIPSTSNESTCDVQTRRKYQQLEFVTSGTSNKNDAAGVETSEYFSSENTKPTETNRNSGSLKLHFPTIIKRSTNADKIKNKKTCTSTEIQSECVASSTSDDSWLQTNVNNSVKNTSNGNEPTVITRTRQSVTNSNKQPQTNANGLSKSNGQSLTKSNAQTLTISNEQRAINTKEDPQTNSKVSASGNKLLTSNEINHLHPDRDSVRVTRRSSGKGRENVDDNYQLQDTSIADKDLEKETPNSNKQAASNGMIDSTPNDESPIVTRSSLLNRRTIAESNEPNGNSTALLKDDSYLLNTADLTTLSDRRKRKMQKDNGTVLKETEHPKRTRNEKFNISDKEADKEERDQASVTELTSKIRDRRKRSNNHSNAKPRSESNNIGTNTITEILDTSFNSVDGDEANMEDSQAETEDSDASHDVTVNRDEFGRLYVGSTPQDTCSPSTSLLDPMTSTPIRTEGNIDFTITGGDGHIDDGDTDSLEECKDLCMTIANKHDIHCETVVQLLYGCNGCLTRLLSYLKWGPYSVYPPPWSANDDLLLQDRQYIPSLRAKYSNRDVNDRLSFLKDL